MTQQTDHDLQRISELRNQSFENAYAVHDVGTALVRDRLAEFNLQVFNHGDDKRDEDTYAGTGVDLGIEHSGETVGWIEVKTKQSADWLGRLNKEDWIEYRGFATYQDEDVFVFFALVEDVDSAKVSRQYFVRVPSMDEEDIAVTLPFESKGHELVEINDEYSVRWPTVVGSAMNQLHE